MIYKVSTQMFQLSNYAAVQQSQLLDVGAKH